MQTPHKILKEDLGTDVNEKDLYVLEYKNSNMIDFLGQVYVNDNDTDDLYVNTLMRNFVIKLTNNHSWKQQQT